VELELPEELFVPPSQSSEIKLNTTPPASVITIDNSNSVPYGCLKNGNKPTYRTWKQNQTRKNHDPLVITSNLNLNSNQNPIPSPVVLEREKKLEILKQKTLN
jgi:hypothetical protein